MMRVEMCHGRNYHYKNQLYRRYADDGVTIMQYEVDGVLAAELLKLTTKRDIPYFRLVMSEEEIEQQRIEAEEAAVPPVVEVTRDPDLDNPPPEPPNVVKVKSKVKKKAKKKVIKKKKTPARTTSSDEGEDNASDEV